MVATAKAAPLSVYMLADHLDAALAAGEDLVSRGADWRQWAEAKAADGRQSLLNQRVILEDVRGFELILIARLLKARDHAAALGRMDTRFSAIAKAFVGGTASLADAALEVGDCRDTDFESGDSVLAYVRSRGLISPQAQDVPSPAHLAIDDQFLVARRIALGPLLDMAATFLDALDIHYDLFAADADGLGDDLQDTFATGDEADATASAANKSPH